MPLKEPTFVHNTTSWIGVVVANLGTPDAPTPKALRRYLKEFLSDRRVVEVPKALWWLILNGIILRLRPRKSAKAYAKIWDTKNNDSPLRMTTLAQSQKLQQHLNARYPNTFKVAVGMRYGKPSMAKAVADLKKQGCDKILLLPLYPHYAGATVGSACDSFFDALKTLRWMPTPRVAAPYFDHPTYIKALATTFKAHLKALSFKPDMVLMSYHGIPQKTHKQGDPYPCHCRKTTRLLTEKLGWPTQNIKTTFQSRFGPAEWVKPYTDEALKTLPQQGVKNLVVMTPAFHTDCLETLEEIALEGRATFLNAGGENYSVIPCLNASEPSITLLEELVAETTSDWLK